MFSPVLITAPATALVSLADAKAWLRVEHADDDVLITALINAATAHLDGWTGVLGRALVTQTWRQDFASFAPVLRLPLFPVSAVSSVRYLDAAGAEHTVSASDYQLLSDALGWLVALKPGLFWPVPGDHLAPVSITYVAGQAAADVPQPIKSAALLLVGDLFRNRETATTGGQSAAIAMSASVNAMLAPYRRVGL